MSVLFKKKKIKRLRYKVICFIALFIGGERVMYRIGVDIGGTGIQAGLVNLEGKIVGQRE